MLYPMYVLFASLLFSAARPAGTTIPLVVPPTDTVAIAASQSRSVLPKGQNHCQIPLAMATRPQWRTDARYQLVFDSVLAQTLPEGAYEVYLSAEPLKKRAVYDSGDATFVDVLNLYQASPLRPVRIAMNATRNVRQWLSQTKMPSNTLYLILFFRGNESPDKKPLPHNGQISMEKVRLVAVW